MNGLWLIIGVLVVSLGCCVWQQYQLRHQITQLTNLLPGGFGTASALSPLYRLRRGIEELTSSQQAIASEQALWQSLLELAPLGYLQVDQDNHLLWCNPAAQTLLRIERWQAGQSRLLIEVVRSYELDRLIEKTRQTQQSQQQTWVYQMTELLSLDRSPKDAQIYEVALESSTVALPQRQVGVFVQNRQPIVDALQARDRTFSDLTHELRTPLTAIRLVAETLQPRLQDPEQGWVSQMLQELDRLMQLVEDALDLSRLSVEPEQALNYEQVPLRSQVESVWQTLKPLADQYQVTLHYQEDPNGLQVAGDARRLMQVWFNLLDNALKYSPDHGEIVFDVTAETEQICINIIDRGSGFKTTDLAHVFERLYRGDPSRLRAMSNSSSEHAKKAGSGLGLSITQQIIQAHGGEITAQNHPQTQGAWLQVKLPKFH
ncbi:MAG: PAS domain-containing protein [Spirulina sp. SIO3F2]|nr:PAS domain-containing protein [Spirulina sp. SIO3F2]